MRSIWHHGAWNRNFGDWVLFDSIQSHLQRVCGEALHFTPVDSQATRYSAELIEKLNDEAELLLVGGGGLLFHRPEDASSSGWQFDIAQSDLQRIRVPLVVYGIGYNRFPFDPAPFPDAFDAHIRAIQQQAAVFSVRNSGTRDELIRRGLEPAGIQVVPDAGIFAPCRPLPSCEFLERAGPLIGVNIAGDRPEHRYAAPVETNERIAMEELADGLARSCDDTGGRVLLIPHILALDQRFDVLIRDRVGDHRVATLPELAPWIYPPRAVTASHFVGAYDRCDLLVGMRGHACLLALGRAKRFVVFGSHDKNIFLLRDVGLGDRILPGASASDIAQVLKQTLGDQGFEARVARVLRTQFESLQSLHQRVVEIFRANGGRGE